MNRPFDAPRAARLVIIEDEALIAEALQSDLVEAGFEIAGVAARIESALKLIDEAAFDAAIVDANLAGVNAAPVGAALAARNVPFVVLSGYTRAQVERSFSGGVFVSKPYRIGQLIDQLNSILPTPRPNDRPGG